MLNYIIAKNLNLTTSTFNMKMFLMFSNKDMQTHCKWKIHNLTNTNYEWIILQVYMMFNNQELFIRIIIID